MWKRCQSQLYRNVCLMVSPVNAPTKKQGSSIDCQELSMLSQWKKTPFCKQQKNEDVYSRFFLVTSITILSVVMLIPHYIEIFTISFNTKCFVQCLLCCLLSQFNDDMVHMGHLSQSIIKIKKNICNYGRHYFWNYPLVYSIQVFLFVARISNSSDIDYIIHVIHHFLLDHIFLFDYFHKIVHQYARISNTR